RHTREALLKTTSTPPTDSHQESGASLNQILDQLVVDNLKVVEQEQQENVADLEAAATDSPVVKLVNYIIHKGVEMRASDIHIEPEDDSFRVRYRVDGHLIEAVRPSSRLLPAVISRIKIMSGMDISERRLPQDGGLTVMIGESPIDLRVSTMAAKLGEKVVMRLVNRDAAPLDLESLGFAPEMLAELRALMRTPHGIVLVTGPTGSGKSTTLYGALAEIVCEKDNISTIEDPVERRLRGTNQFQVNNAAGFTFASALRSLLRQDPDIIMVGEIRDAETAKLATEAALTGHLVLSTLHTNDAPTAVPRLANMGVEPYLLAASLRGVLAQRLVRRICPHCRKPSELTAATRASLMRLCGGTCPIDTVYEGTGCTRCRGQGAFGRVGVFELLRLNEEMLAGIAHDGSVRSVRALAKEQGFVTMLEDGLEKVRQGIISVNSLLEVVARAEDVPTTCAQPEVERSDAPVLPENM
ncbi:MAG: GspE/PulE family protein, partial [Phycisphaeraceae bacterium]